MQDLANALQKFELKISSKKTKILAIILNINELSDINEIRLNTEIKKNLNSLNSFVNWKAKILQMIDTHREMNKEYELSIKRRNLINEQC